MADRKHSLVLLAAVGLAAAAAVSGCGDSGRGSSPRGERSSRSAPVVRPSGETGDRGPEGLHKRGLEARANAAVARFTRIGLPIYCGGNRGRFIALTFDDGSGQFTARDVLPALRRARARATFFVIGHSAARTPALVRREAAAGAVGDHTWNHVDLTGLAPSRVRAELLETRRLLERTTGRPVRIFRPPFGARNATLDGRARTLGMLDVMWSLDSLDARGAGGKEISRRVLEWVRPGSIVLMHETSGTTIRVLPRLLRILRHRRFQMVTVPELLALNPPSPAQLRQGLAGCFRRG